MQELSICRFLVEYHRQHRSLADRKSLDIPCGSPTMLRLPVVPYVCQYNKDRDTSQDRNDQLAKTHVSKDLPP